MSSDEQGLALSSLIPPLIGVRKAKQVINDLLRHVSRETISSHSLRQLEESLQKGREELKRVAEHLREIEKTLTQQKDARVGRFSVGEEVEWTTSGRNRKTHRGTILTTVDAGQYPEIDLRNKLPEKKCNVRYRGYYRYEESYLIEDEEGQQWWPRVGWLHRV